MLQTNSKNPWTCKPVYIASKKRVPSAYTPNSYRIFDYKISDIQSSRSVPNLRDVHNINHPRTQTSNEPDHGYYGAFGDQLKDKPGYIPKHPREATRRNCPHPQSARFLRSNVFKLNKPIPHIATDNTDSDQNTWWEHSRDGIDTGHEIATTLEQTKNMKRKKQAITLNKSYTLPKIVRATAPDNSPWILNHVAANKGLKDTVEHISYQHQYNSRLHPSEPIRGKLHGSFVWTGKDNLPSLKKSNVAKTARNAS